MRYGEGKTNSSSNRRGGVFYMVAGDLNPYGNYSEVGGLQPLSQVVGGGDEEEMEEEFEGDDYLNSVRRRFENYRKKSRRKFHYGFLEVNNPMYIQAPSGFPKFNESEFSAKAYFLLTGRKELVEDENVMDRVVANMFANGMTYDIMERTISRLAKKEGYDAIVWADGEKPLEIFYFGNNKVKWLN